MPVTGRSFLPGNYINHPDWALMERCDMIPPGFAAFVFEGFARITPTPAIAWDILDRNNNPALIPANAREPITFMHVSFSVPFYSAAVPNEFGANTITAVNTDLLKVATAVTVPQAGTTPVATSGDAGTVSATAGVAANGAIQAGEVLSTIPITGATPITVDTTLRLFSAATGGVTAGSNMSVTRGSFYIPVRLVWCRRMRAPSITDPDMSDAMLRINADLVS
jgi:hypothetical protein